MHRLTMTALAVSAPAVLVLSACGDQRAPTEATRPTSSTVALSREDAGPKHAGAIVAHDACDPASFDAALQDENACVKPGNVTFAEFLAELQATKVAREWRFTPEQVVGHFGIDVLGNNVGGEEHTFTPVRNFGGGFIPILNQLSGNLVEAPECANLDPDDVVPSGGKYMIEAEELASVADASGIARVQCCIHPWMRSEVRMQR
jgi:hypothetical protein